jgi:uncharacterized protein YegJ (DUF2314 family)
MAPIVLILLIAAIVAGAGVSGTKATAETVSERIKRDGVAMVEREDPDMAAAIRKARETLPEFLALVRAPRSTITSYAVKIAVAEGDEREFFWISPFRERNRQFTGQINNTPRLVKTVKNGQTITFAEHEIVDWLYREDGRMHGNYTACAILKREPRDQADAVIKQFGLNCEL